jgi:hypothetical protein
MPVQLMFDAGAQRLLQRYRAGQALLITAVNNYGLPGETLTAERYSLALAERDPEVIRVDTLQGVPIYAHHRIAAYAQWRPLRVTAHGFRRWSYLAVAHEDDVWRDLLRWERTHPTQSGRALSRAA